MGWPGSDAGCYQVHYYISITICNAGHVVVRFQLMYTIRILGYTHTVSWLFTEQDLQAHLALQANQCITSM